MSAEKLSNETILMNIISFKVNAAIIKRWLKSHDGSSRPPPHPIRRDLFMRLSFSTSVQTETAANGRHCQKQKNNIFGKINYLYLLFNFPFVELLNSKLSYGSEIRA